MRVMVETLVSSIKDKYKQPQLLIMKAITKSIKYDGKIICGKLKKAVISTTVMPNDHFEYSLIIHFHNAPSIYTSLVKDYDYETLLDILETIFNEQKINLDDLYPMGSVPDPITPAQERLDRYME